MKKQHLICFILGLTTLTHRTSAQQNEFLDGSKSKIVADAQSLTFTGTADLDLEEEKVIRTLTKYDPTNKEVAGLGAIAGALVTPVVSSISTGLKRHSENRALSFEGSHEARNTLTRTGTVSEEGREYHRCSEKYFECESDEQVLSIDIIQQVTHYIPSVEYKRTVRFKDDVNATDALTFELHPHKLQGGRFCYQLASLTSNSTPARLKKKARFITLKIQPTIHYFDGTEKKSTELGTMSIGMVKPGIGDVTFTPTYTDQFHFSASYRFAEMSVVVTETNPNKKKAEKRKDAIAAYNTDENKEGIVNVINLLLPKKEEEGGSNDTAPQVEGDVEGDKE